MSVEAMAAARYAEALFEAARKSGQVELVQESLSDLARVMRPSGLLKFLESPRHSLEEKSKALEKVAKLFRSPLVTGFLAVLLRKSRLSLLDEVTRLYSVLALEALGTVNADVALLGTPNEAFKRRLIATLERITKKKVRLEFRQDPRIVGGFVVKMKNDLIDASVQTRLDILKKQLLQTRIN